MYKFSILFDPQDKVKYNFNFIFKQIGVPNTIIELGTFEGYTSLWLSETYTDINPNLQIYTIDPHESSEDLTNFNFGTIKQNFLFNLEYHDKKNIIYKNKTSTLGLLELLQNNIQAELIYIDGDHTASQVLTDLTLSWQLLKTNGIILCDDAHSWKYLDKNDYSSVQQTPRLALDSFIHCYWHKILIYNLPSAHQVAIQKIKD